VTRFAPGAGLLLSSPVILDALRGRRGVDDALLAMLVATLAAALALWLLGVASRTPPPSPVDKDKDSGEGRGDDVTLAPETPGTFS
jgi:hypothetical protein